MVLDPQQYDVKRDPRRLVFLQRDVMVLDPEQYDVIVLDPRRLVPVQHDVGV